MAYKDFYDLGNVDSALVVSPSLLAVRNAIDSAVTGVSVVSQIAASYAKQYSVVEKQEVASDGTVTDVTSTPRRSVALFEAQDAKRRVRQVQANIDQYLSNVDDAQFTVTTSPVSVSYTTAQAARGYVMRCPRMFDSTYASTFTLGVKLFHTEYQDYVDIDARVDMQVAASDSYDAMWGYGGSVPRLIKAVGSGTPPYPTVTGVYQTLGSVTTSDSGTAKQYSVAAAYRYVEEDSSTVHCYWKLIIGQVNGGAYSTPWMPFTDPFTTTVNLIRVHKTGSIAPVLFNDAEGLFPTYHDRDFWALPTSVETPSEQVLIPPATSIQLSEQTVCIRLDDASQVRAALKQQMPDFASVVTQLDALITPGA